MKCQILVNGTVAFVLTPESEVEKEALKQLCTQDNDIIELRNTVMIIGHNISGGVFIGKRGGFQVEKSPEMINPHALAQDKANPRLGPSVDPAEGLE